MSLEETNLSEGATDWEHTGFKGFKKISDREYVAECEGPEGVVKSRTMQALVNEIASLEKDFRDKIWHENTEEDLKDRVEEMRKLLSLWPQA